MNGASLDIPQISKLLSKICRYDEFYYVCRYVDGVDIEDFQQDCLIRAIQRYPSFDPSRGSLRSFLRLLVKQVASEYCRKSTIKVENLGHSLDYLPVSGRYNTLELRKAIQELPKSVRTVMRMSADGYRWSEIERSLRISRRTRRYLYQMGLDELRRLLV